MIERSVEHFDLYPERLIGDSAYGSAEMLNWLVHDRGIEPHIQYSTNPSALTVPSRATISPTTTPLMLTAARPGKPSSTIDGGSQAAQRHNEGQLDALPGQQARLPGMPPQTALLPEGSGAQDLALSLRRARGLAREIAKTEAYQTSRRQCKKVEMLFAH